MSNWTGKSRGGAIGYSFFIYTIKWFGVGAAYFLLSFVYPFYYWFEKEKKSNLIAFYNNLGFTEKEGRKLVKRNFKLLGRCLIDRFAFLAGRDNFYTFSLDGEENLVELNDLDKGGILLSAHLGNWEIAGNLLRKRNIVSTVNILMLDAEHKKIKNLLEKHSDAALFNVIPITDDFSYLIKLKQAAARKELICLHGDRYLKEAKTINKSFCGKQTKFPAGPFELAKLLDLPVSIVFALKTGRNHYSLSATKMMEAPDAQTLSDAYVNELQKKVESNPEQWFNYYDYFA